MDAGGLVSSLVMAALVGYQIWRRGRSSRHAVLEAVTPPRRLPGEFEADVDAVLADVAGKSPDAIYREGVSLVQPFIGASDFPLDPERLGRGLALLEHVVRLVPTNWAAMWILGMGYRRTRSLVRSRDFLARAYASAPDRVETLVEYQRACLWLGQTDEALPLAQRQVQRTGGNADSRSNLAITLLLHGDVDGAATEAAAAVDRAPDDIVIQRVRALVADVRDGRRVRPRSLLELETPAVPPVGAALLPEEAQRAFDDAFAAYRTVLQADPGRILTSEERAGLEQSIGPISRVEIAATAVQLNWLGRTLRPRLTERTTVVGANGTVWREGRLQMLIEERDGAWRVVQSRLLPLLRPPETVADPVVVPEGVRLPN